MARPCRLQGENIFYHITSRGDNRKKIYISEYDCKKFLEYVLAAKDKYKFYLYAYALMPNHYHLFIETLRPNLSRIMQYINTSYTAYYNKKRHKSGHLFQGRYKSIVVDEDNYFMELTRYIHLNPVRAGIVKLPQEYKWSSFRGYIDKRGDGYVDKEQIGQYFDMKPETYRQFVLEGVNKNDNLFRNVYAGFLLGPAKFIKDKLEYLKDQAEKEEISYRKCLNWQVEKDGVINAIVKYYGRSLEEISNDKRRPMRKKKIAIYLMKKFTNLTNNEIGKVFGMSYSAISKVEGGIKDLIQQSKGVRRDVENIVSTFKV